MTRLFLIDSYALAFRMFYAYAKNPLINTKGQNVSLVHGYWGTILRIIKMHKPEYFAIVRDISKPTFRHKLYAEYKANRKPMPQEMVEQMPFLDETIRESGIPVLEREGFEADDIMAYMARVGSACGASVYIVTKDKDMAQVVSDTVFLYQEEKGTKGKEIGIAQVIDKFGVKPEQIRDYLALIGDTADNIPGVPNIGSKSAVQLLSEWESLDGIYANLDKMSPKKRSLLEKGKDNAFLSRELTALKSDYDFGFKLENLRLNLNRDALYRFFLDYETPSVAALLPSEEPDSLFSILPKNFGFSIKRVTVDSEQAFDAMKRELDSADTLSFVIKEGRVNISANKDSYFEIDFSAVLWEYLAKRFEDKRVTWLFHNSKYVFHSIFARTKVLPHNFQDLMLADWLLDPSMNLNSSPENSAELFGKYPLLKKRLEDKQIFDLFVQKEMPLIRCLFEMEARGIKIDEDAISSLNIELCEKIVELENSIYIIAEQKFNLASPKQLAHILYSKLSLPIIKRNASGPSTDAQTLETLAESNPHPVLEPILNWRELQKLRNGYTSALPGLISNETNRIHTTFLPWGTATGRLSSRDPNLQNIPVRTEIGKKIRAAFIPSQEDFVIISADYSQIELRMLAHLSGDKEFQRAFSEDKDIHVSTAAALFGVKPEDVSPEMRSAAKAVNFGVIYGMGAFRLSRSLHIPRAKAQEFINGYFSLYSEVKNYFDNVVNFARENGYVETITKRRRYLHELQAHDHYERSAAERMAMNTPVQGSAADLIQEAMLCLRDKISAENLPLRMLLQVHDELVFECHKSRAEEFIAIIKPIMENAMKLSVPIKANAGIGKNWLEAH